MSTSNTMEPGDALLDASACTSMLFPSQFLVGGPRAHISIMYSGQSYVADNLTHTKDMTGTG
jgi:hypothetical protein